MGNRNRFEQNLLRSEVSPHGVNRSWYLRPRKGPRRRWVILAAMIGIGWLASPLVIGDTGILRLWELREKEVELSAELQGLQDDERRLSEELGEKDAVAIERTAREKFDLQRENEIVFRFPRSVASTDTVPVQRNGYASPVDTTDSAR